MSPDGLPVVAMVGAGQLARMTHQAAIALGLSLRVLADGAADSAALVAADVTVGDFRAIDDVRSFAKGADVLTFDHEHVPGSLLRLLEGEGVRVRPGAAALRAAQDKQHMREVLGRLGVPIPRWAPVTTSADIEAFAATAGWPVIAKAATGGYDGRGVWPLADAAAAAQLVATGTRLIVEEMVPLVRELSALVARSPYGQGAAWPVVETVQRDGICVEVIAPAPGLDEEVAAEAEALALRVAAELGVVGVLAVELFETADGLVVNELAMRPHNSGHWTIDGSTTSQFEQHLRAVLDWPLGVTSMTTPYAVTANVLGGAVAGDPGHRLFTAMARDPALRVHLYGKAPRPGRKLGHVTALGGDLEDTRQRARRGARVLADGDADEEPGRR
jgi:5-(carboxyamino)imidazole ribonucleotide synthase